MREPSLRLVTLPMVLLAWFTIGISAGEDLDVQPVATPVSGVCTESAPLPPFGVTFTPRHDYGPGLDQLSGLGIKLAIMANSPWQCHVPVALRFHPIDSRLYLSEVARANHFHVAWIREGRAAIFYRGAPDQAIRDIERDLQLADPERRRKALWQAGALEDIRCLPILIAAARSQDRHLAQQAFCCISGLGWDAALIYDPEAIDLFEHQAKQESPDTYHRTVCLPVCETTAGMTLLAQYWMSNDKAPSMVPLLDEQQGRLLIPILRALKAPESIFLHVAMRFGDLGDAGLRGLVEAAFSNPQSLPPDLTIGAFQRCLGAASTPRIKSLLLDHRPGVRQAAMNALCAEDGDTCRQEIQRIASMPDGSSYGDTAYVPLWYALRNEEPLARRVIEDWAKSPDPNARCSALQLVRYYPSDWARALAARLAHDASDGVRENATWNLTNYQLADDPEPDVATEIAGITHKIHAQTGGTPIRENLFDRLCIHHSAQELDVLLPSLTDKDARVRAVAVRSLRLFCMEPALRMLEKATHDSDDLVVQAAIDCIGGTSYYGSRYRWSQEDFLPVLRPLLGHRDATVRRSVLAALAVWTEADQFDCLQDFVDHLNGRIWEEIVQRIQDLDAHRAAPLLTRAFAAGDAKTREVIMKSLIGLQDAQPWWTLISVALADPNDEIHGMASYLAIEASMPVPQREDLIIRLISDLRGPVPGWSFHLRPDATLRDRLLTRLGALRGEARLRLMDLLGSLYPDDAVVGAALSSDPDQGAYQQRLVDRQARSQTAGQVRLHVGDAPPPLKVSTWVHGQPLPAFAKGTVYIVEFWTLGHELCLATTELAKHIHQLSQDADVEAIGIKMPSPDAHELALSTKSGLTSDFPYRIALDQVQPVGVGATADLWLGGCGRRDRETGRLRTPTAFIVGKDGRIAWIGDPRDHLERRLAEALNGTLVTLAFVHADSEEYIGFDPVGRGTHGDPPITWHLQRNSALPLHHEVTLALSQPTVISGVTYLPSQESMSAGSQADFEIFTSDDGIGFGTPVASGKLVQDQELKAFSFPAHSCRFIKLRALDKIPGGPWLSSTDINIVRRGDPPPTVMAPFPGEQEGAMAPLLDEQEGKAGAGADDF